MAGTTTTELDPDVKEAISRYFDGAMRLYKQKDVRVSFFYPEKRLFALLNGLPPTKIKMNEIWNGLTECIDKSLVIEWLIHNSTILVGLFGDCLQERRYRFKIPDKLLPSTRWKTCASNHREESSQSKI